MKNILDAIKNYAGVSRKNSIKEVVDKLCLTQVYGNQLPNYGDDAAIIPWHDEYLLLAADGMMTGLLINEPYAAGKASVMVTVNDIFAMGGEPIGLVNVLASGNSTQRNEIIAGIEKGCRKLQVPMLGGHLHPDAPDEYPALSVSILGHAKRLLRGHLAAEGDCLIFAVDLEGRTGCKSVVSWDANSGKTPEVLRHRLKALPLIAERELANATKDVSNAGIIGTAAIMLENSGRGGNIDLDLIPKPSALSLDQWILCFQSYGFILSVAKRNVDKVISVFTERAITATVIGHVTNDAVVELKKGSNTEVLFDFRNEYITGIRYTPKF